MAETMPIRCCSEDAFASAIRTDVLAAYELRRFAAHMPSCAGPESCAACGSWCPHLEMSTQDMREE